MIQNLVTFSAGCLLVAIFVFAFGRFFLIGATSRTCFKTGCCFLVAGILTWILAFWGLNIYKYQHQPRTITSAINGHVFQTDVLTNPEYITFRHVWTATTNGLELLNLPETNYYWSVWNWLK